MFVPGDVIYERPEVLQITVADEAEKNTLLSGLLIFVSKIIWNVSDSPLEVPHVLGRLLIVDVFT